MQHIVTIFKNIKETDTPFFRDVDVVLSRIKDGSSKELVKNIRQEDDKSKRNDLKKELPSICFSGQFTKRSDVSIKEHSGLICLDFDGYTKQKDLLNDKNKFSKNKFVYSVFISPSGKGLKVLVKIPKDPDNHVGYFIALEKLFKSQYFDKTSKNVSRVCYESFDPLIYINKDAEVWETAEDLEYKEHSANNGVKTIPITDENKIVEILIKWWQKKYPMSEGQRNQNAFILAMAFNDFGISKNTATLVLNQYQSKSFTVSEINKTIKSAYANAKNFNTKFYEDEEKINDIQQRLRRGESKKIIRQQLEESMLAAEVIDSVLQKAEEDNSVKFWTMSSRGVVKAIPLIFKKFLESNGFYKFCPEGQKNYVFVKVTNNLIENTSEKEIKDFILNHLYDMDDMAIYNYFADQTRLFKEDFLSLLGTIDVYFIEDTKDTSYLYFENCAVKITKDDIQVIDYLELDGYVWKDHIIPRPYADCDSEANDYCTFIENVSDQDDDRVLMMRSTLGFLLHSYKNISYCPAIILNDEHISDTANGGTGKGLYVQGLEAMKKVVNIDGKSFNTEKSFPYQLVQWGTQIMVIDDAKKYFAFEAMFSVITEGITVEKKNKDAIKIPFSKSPKLIITTNHPLKGSGSSHERRRFELEFANHYSAAHKPEHEFKKDLFSAEWQDKDWDPFHKYMIKCLQIYLEQGLVQSKSVNTDKKRLIIETNSDFIEWCGLLDTKHENLLLQVNKKIHINELHHDFTSQYPDYAKYSKRSVSQYLFKKWLVAYCVYKEGLEPEIKRDSSGNWMRIKPRSEGVIQKKLL
jgi:hypothetical protein|tara:strand:+ start:305 stop:2719 length:2415 start_codon:yes stop_codon:yes gene_type:complete